MEGADFPDVPAEGLPTPPQSARATEIRPIGGTPTLAQELSHQAFMIPLVWESMPPPMADSPFVTPRDAGIMSDLVVNDEPPVTSRSSRITPDRVEHARQGVTSPRNTQEGDPSITHRSTGIALDQVEAGQLEGGPSITPRPTRITLDHVEEDRPDSTSTGTMQEEDPFVTHESTWQTLDHVKHHQLGATNSKSMMEEAPVTMQAIAALLREQLGAVTSAVDGLRRDLFKLGASSSALPTLGDTHTRTFECHSQAEEGAMRNASKADSEGQRDASKASSAPVAASRKPWRLISARRRVKMRQHHGTTSLHKAAWLAECITCGAFSVACLVMLCLWARHVNEESFVSTFFVTAIAAMTYFAKACHMGDTIIKGDLVPLARYIDWITTTPLMLYELCHIAHATTPMIIMVIMSDLLMLATGIIAALIPWKPHRDLKNVWFGASCFFFIVLLVALHVDVGYKAGKQIEVAANLFKQLEMLTVMVWSLYPVIVGIGRAHLGLITKPTEDICLCILDVCAKLGMEGLIVASCFNGCVEEGAH